MPAEYFEARERALLGERYERLYAAPQETAARGVTVSALRTTPEEFAARADFPLRPSPFCKAAFEVEPPAFKPGRHPYHHAGVFYSQEPSASSAAPLLGVKPGMRVLYLCAAPGGKSSQLAAALRGQGLLVSNEYVAVRAEILKSNLERMGVSNAVVLYETPARIAAALPEFFVEIIEDELNVKKVTFTDDVSAYTSYTFKPQLRTVGPKYGKFLGQIQKALAALDGNAAMAELKANGVLALPSVDESVKLAEEDLLITMTQMEGYVTEGDNTVTVVLDTNLTPELIEEGFVREIISKIQTMRKEAGFEVMDQITIYHKSDEKVSGIFEQYGDTIKSDVLGVNVVADTAGAFADEPEVYSKEWNINGEHVLLGVKKGGN